MGLGQGVNMDFRRYVIRTQIDTHKVQFFPSVPPGFPIILRWSIEGLSAICDSALLQDEFGGFFYKIRMHMIDSLRVGASPPISNLLLIRYGQKLYLLGLDDKLSELPARAMLDQNYPNPFNPSTSVKFGLPVASHVTVEIFNLLGQRVLTLVNEERSAGYHLVEWNGTSDAGAAVGSGVYFLRMNANGGDGRTFSNGRKLLMLK